MFHTHILQLLNVREHVLQPAGRRSPEPVDLIPEVAHNKEEGQIKYQRKKINQMPYFNECQKTKVYRGLIILHGIPYLMR